MRKWMKSELKCCYASTAVILLAGMVLPAHGGPWVQERGHGILIAGLIHYRTGDRFSLSGATEPLGPRTRFRSLTPQLWLEAGLTDLLTGIVSFSVPSQLYTSPAYRASSTSLGDVQIGLRRAVKKSDDGWQLAVQGLLKAPAYSSRVEPRPGNGQADLEISAMAGRSFPVGRRWGFFASEGGYRFRWGRPADQWRGDLAAGLHASRRLTLMGQLFLIRSAGAFPDLGPGVNPQIEPWFHLARLQPSALVRLSPRLRLQSGYGWDLAGRNVGRGRQWIVVLWTSF